MRKYRLRIAWYLSLPLFAGLAMLFLHFPIAPAFLVALSVYFPFCLTLTIFNAITSYEFWTAHALGFPTRRAVQAMITAGCGGVLVGIITHRNTLTEISVGLVLIGIDGLITEHEKKETTRCKPLS